MEGTTLTHICRGSDRQIEPLGSDVFDVVSGVLEIVCRKRLGSSAGMIHEENAKNTS